MEEEASESSRGTSGLCKLANAHAVLARLHEVNCAWVLRLMAEDAIASNSGAGWQIIPENAQAVFAK